jgi:hypothetical protein
MGETYCPKLRLLLACCLVLGACNSISTVTSNVLSSAELFEPPGSGSFQGTGGMTQARFAGAAARMVSGPMAGRILVAGGLTGAGSSTAEAEVYDPATGTFTPVGSMKYPRAYFTATPLSDGTVLMVGGINSNAGTVAVLGIAELFNPSTGEFETLTSTLPSAVWQHVAVPFCAQESSGTYSYQRVTPSGCPSGYEIYVFIAGGFVNSSGSVVTPQVLVYEPTSQTFAAATPLPSPPSSTIAPGLAAAAAEAIPQPATSTAPDIVVFGGQLSNGSSSDFAFVYGLAGSTTSPLTGTWTSGSVLSVPRTNPTATTLVNEPASGAACEGYTIITGGVDSASGVVSNTADIYAPASTEGQVGTLRGTATMSTIRIHHTSTEIGLSDNSVPNAGDVLIAGGTGLNGSSLSSAELFVPAGSGSTCTGSFVATGSMTTARSYQTATALRDGTGRVLIAGGADNP